MATEGFCIEFPRAVCRPHHWLSSPLISSSRTLAIALAPLSLQLIPFPFIRRAKIYAPFLSIVPSPRPCSISTPAWMRQSASHSSRTTFSTHSRALPPFLGCTVVDDRTPAVTFSRVTATSLGTVSLPNPSLPMLLVAQLDLPLVMYLRMLSTYWSTSQWLSFNPLNPYRHAASSIA